MLIPADKSTVESWLVSVTPQPATQQALPGTGAESGKHAIDTLILDSQNTKFEGVLLKNS